MKVLHISTYDRGGAANAAIRLHLGLLEEGVDSKLLTLFKTKNNIPHSYQFSQIRQASFVTRIFKKFSHSFSQKQINHLRLNKYSGSYDYISFPETDYDITKDPLFQEADVINLHWVAQFLDYPSFFKNCKKKIVWTLHDKNPALGGFHLAVDLERNPAMIELEVALTKVKIRALQNVKLLKVVSPSQFLLGFSRNSKALGHFDHYLIPNSVDVDLFKPHNKEFSRRVFNLPEEKKIILFLCENLGSFHKGFDLFEEAIRSFPPSKDFLFVAVGDNFPTTTTTTTEYINVKHINKINDERLMSILYSAAELLVLPSREENLPNVMLESLCCGTPVLSFALGGMLDVIKPNLNGLIAEEVSSKSLFDEINSFLINPPYFDPQKIRIDAVEKFTLKRQALKYKELYQNILQEKD